MSNNYRVDRVNSRRIPCGMNSILYIGDSWNTARAIFNAAQTGLDSWGKPNATYGVVISVWDASKNDYVIKCEKGL